ncbi:uncharacterized protein LOC111284313 [Durio zibethinus]|uniref:Uncharacterized protein LOC111284313 n=1 Tax=Durio zibethinus TaxID=66656 RepID=A0A6P5XLK1_DURZI|nr:uncharacterized protein LOC111284313 [Durio zibethinus]
MERISMGTTITRRAKWQYPPAQPTPRILHLPRRPRRQAPKASPSNLPSSQKERKGKPESLFDEERSLTRGVVPVLLVSPRKCDQERRRERVAEEKREKSSVVLVEEEKWRFQAEMLRAECKLLRMEREIAVKKMERRRVQLERTLKSAVQTLLSGKKNICEGKNVSLILEEQINDFVEKLAKLQRRSGVTDLEVKKCSNFDKQVSFLQRQLEKFGGISDEEICVKEIREMAEASLSIKTSSEGDESFLSNRNTNLQVEILRRKMEGLSKGTLLERMEEEYGSMLSRANSSTTSSASSSKRIDYSDLSLPSIQQSHKVNSLNHQSLHLFLQEKMPHGARVCSRHCKAIVQRIVEQVRAETKQWSHMQEMLGQVRDEMEDLQTSRDFWEDRALDSDYQIQSLQSAVKEWRQKALSYEASANELQAEISILHEEIERSRKERDGKIVKAGISSPINQEAQNETEKRVLVCHSKENHCAYGDGCNQKELSRDGRRKTQTCTAGLLPRRSPLREIGNMSALMKQHGEGLLPLFCLHKEEMKRSF